MRKILFILPNLSGGGAERVIVHICQSLEKGKYDIILALFQKQGVYFNLLPKYIRLIDLNIPRIRNSLPRLITLIRDEKPDFVFSTLTDINMVLGFLGFFFHKFYLIIRESNIISLLKRSRIRRIIYKLCIQNANIVVAQSNDMIRDLTENFKCNIRKIIKINNPVNIDYIESVINEPLDIPFKSDRIILLAIGRLEYQKGFDMLLHTFSQLPNKNDYQVVILGNGSMKEQLKKQSCEEGINDLVCFGNFVFNPYKYMAKADFLISSSRFEGFPNVVIEALACGTPVISNLYPGGINEIINDNVGEIIDISDVNLFKKALSKKYDHDAIKLYCKNKYSIDKIMKFYEHLFIQ
jgi:glycosyltransferase involved in cell wall biosynthesis